MYLHDNPEELQQLVSVTANHLDRAEAYIEKDYYAMMVLREAVSRNPGFVFKGGTCLSKCYGAIGRFSEDVDLGLAEEHTTEGMRKGMMRTVMEAAEALGLSISNLDETRSRRDYNKYLLALPSGQEPLMVETAVITPAAPCQTTQVQSFVGEYCASQGLSDFVAEYGLGPFDVNANSMERTFCDKVFALCDYYLAKESLRRQSRHIYDLRKLQDRIELDDSLASLFWQVKEQRKGKPRCLSADDSVAVADVLDELVSTEAYRDDYKNVTEDLLYEEMPYVEAASALSSIAAFLRRANS